jgi:hypothetical protein
MGVALANAVAGRPSLTGDSRGRLSLALGLHRLAGVHRSLTKAGGWERV